MLPLTAVHTWLSEGRIHGAHKWLRRQNPQPPFLGHLSPSHPPLPQSHSDGLWFPQTHFHKSVPKKGWEIHLLVRRQMRFNNLECYLSLVDWHVYRGFQELGGGVMGEAWKERELHLAMVALTLVTTNLQLGFMEQ